MGHVGQGGSLCPSPLLRPGLAARRLQQPCPEVGRRGGQGGRAPHPHPSGVWGWSVPRGRAIRWVLGDFSLSGGIWPSLGRCFQFWLRVSCLDPALDITLSLPGACPGVRSQQSTCLVLNIAGLLPDFSPCFPPAGVLGLVLGLPPWCLDLLPGQPGCCWSQGARVQAFSSLSALVARPPWRWLV